MHKERLFLAISVLLSCALAFCSSASRAEKVLEGYVCSERVHKLTSELEWYKSLRKAEDAARDQNKLVFWLHLVGKIDGAT